MRTRRGTSYWPGPLGQMIYKFKAGDIVNSVLTGAADFLGVVVDVSDKTNKVSVDWGAGSRVQHDPDEIQLCHNCRDDASERMRSVVASGLPWFEALESRRAILAKSAEEAEKDSQYIGDPKTHGLDKPRGGGFSIMQNLQKDLHEESQEEAEKAEPRKWERSASELRSRRGMYWCSPDRTYRLTKGEQEGGQATCPKCKAGMELEPYTRSEKMWRCPKCGFKVPSGKAVTQRPQVEVEVEPDGEVEITVSSLKSRREQ